MHNLTENSYILVSFLVLGLIVFIVSVDNQTACASDQIVWKMATKMPPGSLEGKAFQRFADLVEKKSDGRMKINVFPSEQLGKTYSVIEAVRAGTVQIYPEGSSYLQRYVEGFKTVSLPFVFRSREHWSKYFKSERVQKWRKELRNEYNIRLLGDPTKFVRGPFRVMVSTKPVLNLEDVQGLKLRMHPDDLAIKVWERLGADVSVLGWTEIYESMNRGLIQACNSPIGLVKGMAFHEVGKYILRHNEYPQGMGFMTNNKQFENLPEDLQEVVLEAYNEACEYSRKLMYEGAEEAIDWMVKEANVTYIRAPMDQFREKLRPLYKEMEEKGELPKGIIDYIKNL